MSISIHPPVYLSVYHSISIYLYLYTHLYPYIYPGLASGWATGICGDFGVRAVCHQPKFFVGMILGLIFAGVMVCIITIIYILFRSSVMCRYRLRYLPLSFCFFEGGEHTREIQLFLSHYMRMIYLYQSRALFIFI